MSSMHAFDTLAFAKKLKQAGYTEAQAEALAEAQGDVFREMLESSLASKGDIRQLKDEVTRLAASSKAEIQSLKAATKADIRQLKDDIDRLAASTKTDIRQLKDDIGRLAASTKTDIRQLKDDIGRLAASTKADIQGVKDATSADIQNLKIGTKADIDSLRREMQLMGQQIVIRLGGMLVAAVAVLAALNFFH